MIAVGKRDKVLKFIGETSVFLYWMLALIVVFLFKDKYVGYDVVASTSFFIGESNFLLSFGWLSVFSFLIFILNKIYVRANILGFAIYFPYFLIVYCEFSVDSICHCFL